ncbi:Peroxiredoxin-6 [Anabarilius grahami]|uniref:Peroxiredoxin-6 n=1 Tax=Anabarilius grahami TaxID=495550 RepID=A0A3N0XRE8_ANAGA|nr:Peroxiredoxin-6 [Anabarilius grahami]
MLDIVSDGHPESQYWASTVMPFPMSELSVSSISWGVLFSHPRDFTPVCTTELGRAAQLSPEFSRRNAKLIALSVDSLEDHHSWSKVRFFQSEVCLSV